MSARHPESLLPPPYIVSVHQCQLLSIQSLSSLILQDTKQRVLITTPTNTHGEKEEQQQSSTTEIQFLSLSSYQNKPIYIGSTTVSILTHFPVSKTHRAPLSLYGFSAADQITMSPPRPVIRHTR